MRWRRCQAPAVRSCPELPRLVCRLGAMEEKSLPISVLEPGSLWHRAVQMGRDLRQAFLLEPDRCHMPLLISVLS